MFGCIASQAGNRRRLTSRGRSRDSPLRGVRLPLAHSGAVAHRHFDLFWCKLEREAGTRYMCCMEARTFHSAAAQIDAAKLIGAAAEVLTSK